MVGFRRFELHANQPHLYKATVLQTAVEKETHKNGGKVRFCPTPIKGFDLQSNYRRLSALLFQKKMVHRPRIEPIVAHLTLRQSGYNRP